MNRVTNNIQMGEIDDKRPPFKILCIDGGGIKGLYSAKLLARFEEEFDTTISDSFDLLCGTSTGGIIALGASLRIPMNHIVDFYQKYGPGIFNEKCKRLPWGRLLLKFKQTAMGGKYSNTSLRSALESVFKDARLGESHNFLCIPSYNTITGTPRVFKKDYGRYTIDDKIKYVDVALATSAAPTYLPMIELNNQQYVDGGLWANNPVLVGLEEFLTNFSNDDRFCGVQILSISSFEKGKGETHHALKRSFWSWKDSLFDAYSIGQSKSAVRIIEQLQGNLKFPLSFYRIVNQYPSSGQDKIIDMDNASEKSLKLLLSIADDTANNMKMNKNVISFFRTNKTLDPKNYSHGK